MKCLHLDNKGKTEESHKQLGWVPIRKTMHTDTCHAEIKHCKNSFPQEKKTLRRNPKTVYAVLQEQHKIQTIWMIVKKISKKRAIFADQSHKRKKSERIVREREVQSTLGNWPLKFHFSVSQETNRHAFPSLPFLSLPSHWLTF